MYKGKEPCQGCGKSGTELSRDSKDKLCTQCNDLFDKGKAIDRENAMEYVLVRDWVNGLPCIDFNDRLLDKFANDVFDAVNNPEAKYTLSVNSPRAQYLGSRNYKLPKPFAELFLELLNNLSELVRTIRVEKEQMPELVRNMLRDTKNEIYNQGVEAGRELLMSLNRGEITMDDFNRNIIKY